jgi:hypothetical protein
LKIFFDSIGAPKIHQIADQFVTRTRLTIVIQLLPQGLRKIHSGIRKPLIAFTRDEGVLRNQPLLSNGHLAGGLF